MIAHLRGTVSKLAPGEATVDVAGVGYRVLMPLSAWDTVEEGAESTLWICTYIREDRFDLFGFADRDTKTLFQELITREGIGPKIALELCSVPRNLLVQAMDESDASMLTAIKGIGRKTAEKLLIELKSLAEKHPTIFVTAGAKGDAPALDRDAVAALSQLGYRAPEIVEILKKLPKTLRSTEERVTAALRSL